MNKDSKNIAEVYTEGVKKAVKGGVLGAAGGALLGGALGAVSGASKGAAATSWVPAIGPLAAVKAAGPAIGAATGGIAGAKKGAAIGGVGGATLGALSKDEEAEGQLPEFIQQIKKDPYPNNRWHFGVMEDGKDKGKMYAITDVKYDDGDRYFYDYRLVIDGQGYTEGISDEEADRLYKIADEKYPQWNS
jgi:hypothetical protein